MGGPSPYLVIAAGIEGKFFFGVMMFFLFYQKNYGEKYWLATTLSL